MTEVLGGILEGVLWRMGRASLKRLNFKSYSFILLNEAGYLLLCNFLFVQRLPVGQNCRWIWKMYWCIINVLPRVFQWKIKTNEWVLCFSNGGDEACIHLVPEEVICIDKWRWWLTNSSCCFRKSWIAVCRSV